MAKKCRHKWRISISKALFKSFLGEEIQAGDICRQCTRCEDVRPLKEA